VGSRYWVWKGRGLIKRVCRPATGYGHSVGRRRQPVRLQAALGSLVVHLGEDIDGVRARITADGEDSKSNCRHQTDADGSCYLSQSGKAGARVPWQGMRSWFHPSTLTPTLRQAQGRLLFPKGEEVPTPHVVVSSQTAVHRLERARLGRRVFRAWRSRRSRRLP
jgi:hypothetical protein